MSDQVQVSRNFIRAIGGLLVLCCVIILFLLSRQSSERGGGATPTPLISATARVEGPGSARTPVSSSGSPIQSLEERLDTLDGKVESISQRTGEATPTPPRVADGATPVQGEVAGTPESRAVADYLKKVDSIVGASAMTGPLPIAAKLLERGMASDPADSDALIQQTSQAKADLAAVTPPSECQEHHTLLLGQLSEAVVILREVRTADASGDVTRLAALAESSLKSQEEAAKLSEIDRRLRSRIRP